MLEQILKESSSSAREKLSFAGPKLSTLTSQWGLEAVEQLKETYPWFVKFKIVPHLEPSQTEGYGVGFLHVRQRHLPASADDPSSISVITVPVVIRDFELAPLDIFSFKGRFYPLTEQRVERVLRVRDTFIPSDRDERAVRASMNYGSPLGSNSGLPNARGLSPLKSLAGVKLSSVADLCGLVEDSIQESEEKGFIDLVSLTTPDDFSVSDSLVKAAEDLSEVLLMEFERGTDALRCRPVFRVAPGSSFEGPWEKISAIEAQAILKSKGYSDLLSDGYYFLGDPSRKSEAYGLGKVSEETEEGSLPEPEVPAEIASGYLFTWVTPDGAPLVEEGVPVFDLTTSEDPGPPSSWEYATHILLRDGSIIPREGLFPVNPVLFTDDVSIDYGDPEVLVAPPAWGVLGSATVHFVHGPEGLATIHIRPSPANPGFEEVAGGLPLGGPYGDGVVEIPTQMSPFDDFEEELPPEETEVDPFNVKVSSLGEGRFAIKSYVEVPGAPLSGGTSRREVLRDLALYGVHPEDASGLLEKASQKRVATWEVDPPEYRDALSDLRGAAAESLRVSEKTSAILRSNAPAIKRIARSTHQHAEKASRLLKESSGVANALDIIAGVNFLSEGTIQKFIEMIPSFEAVLSDICSLLLASRLGLQEIVERELKETMEGLDSVLSGLRRIEYSLTI